MRGKRGFGVVVKEKVRFERSFKGKKDRFNAVMRGKWCLRWFFGGKEFF